MLTGLSLTSARVTVSSLRVSSPCVSSLVTLSPLSCSATVQLSSARLSHPRPRPSCRRAGPRHPTPPATDSRPATKPVIVGLDLTGKLLLWDASLLLVMLSFLLESRRSGILPTLADFSDPEADG